MGKKKEERKSTLKLEGNLSIYEAVAIREKITEALKGGGILEINISDVVECDTSGLQLLCSAKKTADRENKKICLSIAPGAVQDAMTITGITHGMIAHDGGTECQR